LIRRSAGHGIIRTVLEFWPSNLTLTLVQALCVLLPAAGLPAWLRFGRGWGWALVPPLSIVLVIAAVEWLPDTADALTWLALIACPLLTAACLGWAMHGAWWPLSFLAIPLLIVAWTDQNTLLGEGCATALTALSCVTLGRLIAGVTPLGWLKLGIVAMAAIDAYLVFTQKLEKPNATLNAAVPAPGLPQLQSASFGSALIGYGDFFVAAVFGAVVSAEGGRSWAAAGLAFGCCYLFDLFFLVTNTLPATVPIAVALLAYEVVRPRGARSRLATWRPSSSAVPSPPGSR
jgi:hypothetical protein